MATFIINQLVGAFAHMIASGCQKMVAGEEANPVAVIETTGTTRLCPDECSPDRAFAGYGYCDPYFGWLTPALEEANRILGSNLTEETAIMLWSNGWCRAFLIALYERNDEEWELGEDGPELYDKLEFNVRTRRGFVDWMMSGEIYGFNLPGHESILRTKESMLLRNRKRGKVSGG